MVASSSNMVDCAESAVSIVPLKVTCVYLKENPSVPEVFMVYVCFSREVEQRMESLKDTNGPLKNKTTLTMSVVFDRVSVALYHS